MKNFAFSQKRMTRRIRLAEPVRFQFKDPEHYGASLSCDVSEGGLKINLNQFIPLNEELDLSICLDDEKTIDCRAKVVWIEQLRYSERFRAGLEFIQSENFGDSRNQLKMLVSSDH